MKNKRMTIHRIAELAGVNASTVSRVFNPNCRNSISAPVSQKILAIAEKYEYAPKNSARSLACGQSFNLGILLHDLERDFTSPAYSLVISEFCREAVRHGYQAVLLPVENGNFDQGTARHIRGGNADAYLAGYPLMGTESMQELKKRNIPVVSYISDKLWDSSSLRGSVVYLDNAPAFEQMFTTVREYGFSDFALFCPEGKFNSSRFVFYEQYHSYGLNLKERILFKAESSPMLLLERARTAAKAQIKRILKHQLIICSTDLVALGLCAALHEAGITPGKEISVIGYDNIEENPAFHCAEAPFLATIAKDDARAGAEMVRLLLRQLKNSDSKFEPEELPLPARFIARASLGRV